MYATMREANDEYVRAVGAEKPDQAWIGTPYDTIEPNPFYTGPPVPHPDSSE